MTAPVFPAAPGRTVRAAVLGTGAFGAGIVAQAAHVPNLDIVAVADIHPDTARKAFGNLPPGQIVVCDSHAAVRQALEAGRRVVTADAALLMDQPLEVVVEATGHAEAGARHAQLAIAQGKHVAMVTKETDAAVGPILKHLADAAGVVYTAVDGDQHGLLIGLVRWARRLGLAIECAGKALDGELVCDPAGGAIRHYGTLLPVAENGRTAFAPSLAGLDGATLRRRTAALGAVAGARPWDLVELAIAANGTGLDLDIPETHCPPLWMTEIPATLCSENLGGILGRSGMIDAVQVLRQAHEPGMGGGVFVVVRAQDEAIRGIFQGKGAVCNPDGTAALIMQPHHLLGIEAVGSILAAGLSGLATGAWDYRPRYDVVYRAAQPLAAGSVVGHDHSPELTAQILPARRLAPGTPLPAGLAQGARLRENVMPGEVITLGKVERPAHSVLWSLREQQDARFPV